MVKCFIYINAEIRNLVLYVNNNNNKLCYEKHSKLTKLQRKYNILLKL
jgi:hypothetical protein